MRFSTLFITFFALSFSARGDVSGIVVVIDGDTISVGGENIELWGVDAPEPKQTCTVERRHWNCGEVARAHLRTFVGNNLVSCVQKGRGDLGKAVFKCAIGTLDIGAEMVEVGLAIPYWQYSGKYYLRSYKEARGLGRGMHAGTFMDPWEWRRLSGGE